MIHINDILEGKPCPFHYMMQVTKSKINFYIDEVLHSKLAFINEAVCAENEKKNMS
jgi:hypothetical protein